MRSCERKRLAPSWLSSARLPSGAAAAEAKTEMDDEACLVVRRRRGAVDGGGRRRPGGVEFGRPDFSNGLSRPGLVSCDWSYESYFRACPTPQLPPKPAPASAKSKQKS